jgi:hypothetical protein
MVTYHRIFRCAMVGSAVLQAALLSSVAYLNCGATSPVLSAPPCAPWVPSKLIHWLPAVFTTLATPGLYIVPLFFPPQWMPLPWWLHEWTWMLLLGLVNIALWTCTFGMLAVTIRRMARAFPLTSSRKLPNER